MWLLSVICALAMHPTNERIGTLVVEVQGITQPKGELQIGVYNNAQGFGEKEKVYIGKVVGVNSNTVTVSLPQLPHGTYAICVFHDKNKNGILDKSLLGIPTEAYGFSNNVRGTFGLPSFDAAKFEFNSSKNKISLVVK